MNQNTNDSLSALMDGELHGEEQQLTLTGLLSDPLVRGTWHAYHVTADVLRSTDLATASQDLQFLAKLEARLEKEPLPGRVSTPVNTANLVMQDRYLQRSANGPLWRVLAGVVCTALVAVIGVSAWLPRSAPEQLANVALPVVVDRAPPQAVAVGPDGMMRDPRLDQLLNAHQQLGGHSALQMPAGFLRNATYEGTVR